MRALATHRLLFLARRLSAVCAAAIVVAWIVVSCGLVDPQRHRIRLGPSCHVSLQHFDGASIVIFNDGDYGPYRGSIVGLAGDPNGPIAHGFGSTAGIYYRHFRWPDGSTLWTLSVSLIYPLMLASILPIGSAVIALRQRLKAASETVNDSEIAGESGTKG